MTPELAELRSDVRRALDARAALDARHRRDVRRWWAALPVYDRAVLAVYSGWLPPELAHLVVSDVARLIDRGQLAFALDAPSPPLAPVSTALAPRRCRARAARRRRRPSTSSPRRGADPPPPPSVNVDTPDLPTAGGVAQNIGKVPRVRSQLATRR